MFTVIFEWQDTIRKQKRVKENKKCLETALNDKAFQFIFKNYR
jgi:hypothetical protein